MAKLTPREIPTPRPSMSLTVPDGMSPVEFFNSAANLKNLAEENGLFRTPEDLLMYRKLIGHSTEVADVLLGNNRFLRVARDLREQVIQDPQFANEIRWRPAYKQIIYRDDKGRLIVTISQNSVGNAITELLGIVVNRVKDNEAYAKREPALVDRLLEARERLIAANLGEAISAPCWPNGEYVACR